MLSLHLIHGSLRDLFRPLIDPLQIAPPAFLVATAALARALPGPIEMRLRGFPFLCGMACFLVFAAFCRRRLEKSGAAVAVGFFALSAPFIYYTTEVKQYASDALAALVLLVLALPCLTQGLTTRRALGLAVAGSLAIWFSHPAIFVLAGIACAVGYQLVIAGRKGDLVRGVAVAVCWGISFVAFYLVAIRPNSGIQSVQEFHRDAFLPIPPRNLGQLRTCVQALFGMFIYPGGFSAPVLAFLLTCWGLGWSERFSRAEKVLLLLPLFFCGLASMAQRYPFTGRLLLFFAPILLIFVAEGAACCAQLLAKRRLAWLPALLLLFQPAGNALERLVHPEEVEEIRPVLAYLSDHALSGDTLFIHHEARWNFAFYHPTYPLSEEVTIRQAEWTDKNTDYIARLAELVGHSRVWLLFAHTPPSDQDQVLIFARVLGTEKEHLEAKGASVWLFDFNRRKAEQ